MEEIFRFKQFAIRQERCAMKVGTDGVLLGAWTSLANNPRSILDIGAGTGLLALMLAQRSEAEVIDAVEIDENAYVQCVENFENSPWPNRLFCYHATFEQFAGEPGERYDLIVSNPPFYTETVAGKSPERDIARQTASLSFERLLQGVINLLAPGGAFCTIVPYREESRFCEAAGLVHLHARRITRVKGNPAAGLKRSLLEFVGSKAPQTEEELVIERGRHEYSEAYSLLTREFYLKF